MQSWSLTDGSSGLTGRALGLVVAGLGRPHFAESALTHLGPLLGIGSWAVYRLFEDRPPVMHLSASHRIADTTGECFAIYRDALLYKSDTSFDPVLMAAQTGCPMMLRMAANEAPTPDHREAIYVRHGMTERISVARLEDDGSMLAVNVYRHHDHGRFSDSQVERFGDIGAVLIAAVARHVEWLSPTRQDCHRAMLTRRCGTLTERELDVLERLLQGMTYDGIAIDMGVGVASVKTYRARAFERLGIHFRNELFALVLASNHASSN